MYKDQNLDAYRMAILQNVHVEPVPLGEICGIYKELVPGVYQIFLNEELINDEDTDPCDKTLYILMKHHNSDRRGETKVVTLADLDFFKRLRDEVKRYEQKAVDGFLNSMTYIKRLKLN
ncbi:hypothetical protein AB4114_11255 [Paenibacillus sp. 2RAB27]|uniref:hypothetical protein n=1 Tax=Paenibacillus sp. 2RAB27 TaxID=3232991 RepID=UPI003F96D99E